MGLTNIKAMLMPIRGNKAVSKEGPDRLLITDSDQVVDMVAERHSMLPDSFGWKAKTENV